MITAAEDSMGPPQAEPRLTATASDNITRMIIWRAKVTPDAPVIVTENVTLDYAALDRAVRRCAWDLRAWGIGPGDRVTLVFSDEVLLVISLLAVGHLGATAMAIPRSSTPAQCSEWVARAGADRCLTDLTASTIPDLPVLRFDQSWLMQAINAAASLSPDLELEVKPQAPLMIVVGSGSTGRPKLIPITHAQMHSRAMTLVLAFDIGARDRMATMTHLEYAAGIHRFFSAVAAGAAYVLPDRAGARFADLRLRYSVTLLSATVFHIEQMLKTLPPGAPRPLDGLMLTASSSIVSGRLRREVSERLCSDFRISYGANETWMATLTGPGECLRHEGTVGRPAPGVQVQIVDGTTQPVRMGDVGLIRIKSASVVNGYLDGDAASQTVFRDGWVMPGDVGRLTEDGHLIFYGRADDMMIFNGINIYPIEIEQCLLSHPAVADAIAVPVKHRVYQDLPAAIVSLKAINAADEQALIAYTAEKLGVRAPRHVVIVDRIPRNQQGKPRRLELLQLVEVDLLRRSEPLSGQRGALTHVKLETPQSEEVRPRQLSRRINLDFQPPGVLQPGAIDAWLAILNPDLEASRSAPPPTAAEPLDRRIAEWLERVMLLARELLQVAQMPVFDAPTLVSCQPQGQGRALWRAVIAVPACDHVPARVCEIAFGVAVRTATWMMTQAPTTASRQALFERLQREAIQPLMQLASGGKSTLPLLREAHSRGIPFRSLGGGIYQLGLGTKGRLTDRSTSDRDSAIGAKLAHSKPLTAQALRLAGLPAPTHQVVTSAADARGAAERFGWPVVVKPADLDRGEGVSMDVDATRIEDAFKEAHGLSKTKQVIVERQVEGVCHRLFLMSGRLLYAVKRLPMGVYGDGTQTVAALVATELTIQAQRPPWRRSELRPIDDLARAAIGAAGLLETSVPAAGHFVPLRRIESGAWGGIDEEVTEKVHPENLRLALAAAELIGLDVAGVDIISPDISEPWNRNGAIINEVNFAPLLGGGEISRRHIGEYVTRLLEGDGRIPLEVFLGGEAAWLAAIQRRMTLGGDGSGIFVTSAERTLDDKGQEIPMPFQSLYRRSQALLLSRQVRTLLLVVQDDEWLRTGLPVEYVDNVVDAGSGLRQHQSPGLPLLTEQEQALRQLLADRNVSTLTRQPVFEVRLGLSASALAG